MSSMTRKDFVDFASILRDARLAALDEATIAAVERDLTRTLATKNPLFDRDRFQRASMPATEYDDRHAREARSRSTSNGRSR